MPEKLGTRSLSVRISTLIFIICIIAGSFGALITLETERSELLTQEKEALTITSARYQNQFSHLLEEKERIAQSSNDVVANNLFTSPFLPNANYPNLPPAEEGWFRNSDHFSSAMLPHDKLTSENNQLVHQSAQLWQVLAPTMTQQFLNYYLITDEDFLRITPKDWSIIGEERYQFDSNPVFQLAGEQSNPGKKPVWTPVYFDETWSKWMTSLIVPIYENGEFTAITGSDFLLDEIFNRFRELADADRGRYAFLFDLNGNVLVEPEGLYVEAGVAQASGQETETGMSNYAMNLLVHDTIVGNVSNTIATYDINDETYIFSVRQIPGMTWYLGVYNRESKILGQFFELQQKLFVLFLSFAIVVALLLQFVLFRTVLRPINSLLNAVQVMSQGDLSVSLPKQRQDELGLLSQAFEKMAGNINDLFKGLSQRIDEKERAEKAARKLSKAVSFSSNGILITDQRLDIEYVNPKLSEMTGRTESFYISKSIFDIIAQDMAFLAEEIEETISVKEQWRGDILLKTRNQPIWITLSIAPIFSQEKEVTNYVCSAQDISFIKESQRKMEQLAYFDVLTNLANRTFFKVQLKKSLALSKRGHYSFALLYFDIDEFKRINDTLGHDMGDKLLVEIANRLKNRLRTEDTVARLGGDEFAILLSGVKDKYEVQKVVEMIQTILVQPFMLANNEVFVSASIGITLAPFDSDDEEVLLKRADLAMYEAKRLGKNTYYFYSSELDIAAKDQLIIENELRVALKEKQLELYYQPQIDVEKQQIVGFEALIRWRHPEKGMIPPIKFIPVAEMTGLIVQLGEWVLWEACRFAQRIRSQYGFSGSMSVNLSARQFKEAYLSRLVAKVLLDSGLPAEKLDLEITESMLMGDIETAINQLHELKQLGLALSIDDFGTGYSSLSYLKRFPVDTLKVDRSFIKDIPFDKHDEEIAGAIIAMAQKLNLSVIAEGVETDEQIEFLKRNRCRIVQGYYYSPPLTSSGVENILDMNKGFIFDPNVEEGKLTQRPPESLANPSKTASQPSNNEVKATASDATPAKGNESTKSTGTETVAGTIAVLDDMQEASESSTDSVSSGVTASKNKSQNGRELEPTD